MSSSYVVSLPPANAAVEQFGASEASARSVVIASLSGGNSILRATMVLPVFLDHSVSVIFRFILERDSSIPFLILNVAGGAVTVFVAYLLNLSVQFLPIMPDISTLTASPKGACRRFLNENHPTIAARNRAAWCCVTVEVLRGATWWFPYIYLAAPAALHSDRLFLLCSRFNTRRIFGFCI